MVMEKDMCTGCHSAGVMQHWNFKVGWHFLICLKALKAFWDVKNNVILPVQLLWEVWVCSTQDPDSLIASHSIDLGVQH